MPTDTTTAKIQMDATAWALAEAFPGWAQGIESSAPLSMKTSPTRIAESAPEQPEVRVTVTLGRVAFAISTTTAMASVLVDGVLVAMRPRVRTHRDGSPPVKTLAAAIQFVIGYAAKRAGMGAIARYMVEALIRLHAAERSQQTAPTPISDD